MMCTCGRMGIIMTKLRSNLLTITLDALMMIYINGPSMDEVVALVAAEKDPAMASSPTVNLLELCTRALKKWKEQKARCPERSHPGVSRARKAAARNLPAHHNDNGDADTFSVEPGSGQTVEELAILAALNAEDEDVPELVLPDAETNFALVGPYKPAAGFEVVPKPSPEVMQAGLQLKTGFMRDRRLVQLFDCPQGWQDGTITRRCVRQGKPSNVYDIKYPDGFIMTQECDPDVYGATNGKKWCIIQPIQREDVEGSDSEEEVV